MQLNETEDRKTFGGIEQTDLFAESRTRIAQDEDGEHTTTRENRSYY